MGDKPKKKKNGAVQDMFSRMGILGELLGYLWRRKLYWLIPMVLTLIIFIALIIVGNAGPAGSFIYTLF